MIRDQSFLFIHKKNAEDEINFRSLIEDESIKKNLNSSTNISLLWDDLNILFNTLITLCILRIIINNTS